VGEGTEQKAEVYVKLLCAVCVEVKHREVGAGLVASNGSEPRREHERRRQGTGPR
jgi:hypothetical protein